MFSQHLLLHTIFRPFGGKDVLSTECVLGPSKEGAGSRGREGRKEGGNRRCSERQQPPNAETRPKENLRQERSRLRHGTPVFLRPTCQRISDGWSVAALRGSGQGAQRTLRRGVSGRDFGRQGPAGRGRGRWSTGPQRTSIQSGLRSIPAGLGVATPPADRVLITLIPPRQKSCSLIEERRHISQGLGPITMSFSVNDVPPSFPVFLFSSTPLTTN